MNVTKESITIVMSNFERDDILKHLGVASDFLEEAVKTAGDVEVGTPMCAVLDAQKGRYARMPDQRTSTRVRRQESRCDVPRDHGRVWAKIYEPSQPPLESAAIRKGDGQIAKN